MELVVQGFSKDYVVEVGEDDTTATMRQKVASAEGLCEDSFHMGFGGKDEGEDITQLEPGATITLTKTPKYEAIIEACLLLQAEGASVVPDGFLVGSSLTRLDLSAVSFVTRIGYAFLSKCTSLTSVDLSGLSNVTVIGGRFLRGCNSLTTLDLTPFNNVTDIGCSFLWECESLTTLDLSPFRNVTQIDEFFLFCCTALKTLDLSPLNNVTDIRNNFVNCCEALTSIYLTGCSSAVSNKVRNGNLKHLVVEERPKRSFPERA